MKLFTKYKKLEPNFHHYEFHHTAFLFIERKIQSSNPSKGFLKKKYIFYWLVLSLISAAGEQMCPSLLNCP